MFGYVQPMRPELKVRDMTLYKAIYCGQCKSLARRYGTVARSTLSYDTTLIAIIGTAISPNETCVSTQRCIVNPLKKKPVCNDNKAISFAADINVVMAYNKFRDDYNDERSKKAVFGRIALRRSYNKVKKRNPKLVQAVEKHINELAQLENDKCDQMDEVADVFGRLMQDVISFMDANQEDKRALEWFAYNLGKWIYLMDAYDDLERDVRSGSYNVLWLQYGKGDDVPSCKKEMKERVEFNLKTALSQCAAAYELISLKRYKELLDNIIYLGLMDKTEGILKGETKQVNESI